LTKICLLKLNIIYILWEKPSVLNPDLNLIIGNTKIKPALIKLVSITVLGVVRHTLDKISFFARLISRRILIIWLLTVMFWWLACRLSNVYLFDKYTQKRPLDTREEYVMSFGGISLPRAIRYSICGILNIFDCVEYCT